MALFQGEDMVDVTTPDGRTLTLPRSIVPASLLPQISTAPAPSALPQAPAPISVPAQQPEQTSPMPVDVPPDNAEPMSAPGIVEMGDPTVRQVDAKQLAKEQAQAKAAALKAQQAEAKAQAAYKQTGMGQTAGAQKKQDEAAQGQEAALLNQADVDAATQDVIGNAVADRNKALDDLFVKRNDDMAAAQQAEDKKLNEIIGLRKKIAGTKVDRSLDHPILLAISAALTGLGEAMSGQKITSGQLISNAIDRKVAAQEADLDQMAKVYGMTKEELDMLKDKSKRKLEFHNAMIAAETDKAIRHIEEITARSASEKTKALAQVAIADLKARAADKTMEATRWGVEYDQRDKHQKQQIQLGYANLGESRRHNMMDEQLKREDMYLDQQKYLAGLKAKGDEEAYKAQLKQSEEVGKRGIRDLNGDLFLSPAGKQKMEQAAQLEQQAQQLEEAGKADALTFSVQGGKDRVAMMRQKAAQLRGEASLNDAVMGHSDTEAVTVSNMLASGQDVVQLIDGIKALSRDVGRRLVQRDEAAVKLRAMFAQLKPGLKEAWQLGAWDKGASNLVAEVIGQDPTSEWNVGAIGMLVQQKMYEDPNAFASGLDSVATQLENKAKNRMTQLGAKFGKDERILYRAPAANLPPAAIDLTEQPSGTEMTKNAEDVGIVGKTARAVGYPFSPSHAQEAEQSQSTKYIGLNKTQEAPFDKLLTAYKAGDTKAADDIVRMVAETAQKRPDLAVPLLQNLQTYGGPALYNAARSAVPKDSETDKVMSQAETNRVGPALEPTPTLITNVLTSIDKDGKVGDQDGYRELAARAAQKDPAARDAILEIVKRSGQQRMPQGSVFREGR